MADDELPDQIKQVLREWNVTDAEIQRLTPESRLVLDLRVAGDDFFEIYEILSGVYGTEPALPDGLFTSETSWKALMVSLSKYIPYLNRYVEKYNDITLNDLHNLFLHGPRKHE